jgi:hypothetical protein
VIYAHGYRIYVYREDPGSIGREFMLKIDGDEPYVRTSGLGLPLFKKENSGCVSTASRRRQRIKGVESGEGA